MPSAPVPAPPPPAAADPAATPGAAPVVRNPPWLGPLLIAAVVALWVLGTVTSASWPKLLEHHPLGLMALNPRYRFMVVAAPRIGVPQFLAVGVARLLLSDPLYFLIGRRYGDRAITWFADSMGGADRPGNLVTTLERLFKRGGTVLVALACGPIVCVLAGAARMSWRKFLTFDLLGTAAIVACLRLFSDTVKPWIDGFNRFNKQHSRQLLIVSVLFTVLFVAQGASSMRRRVKGLKDLTE